MTNFERVKKFMETFGQEIKQKASFPSNKITSLRYNLIREELEELKEALDNKDIKEVADALASGSKIQLKQSKMIRKILGSPIPKGMKNGSKKKKA